MDEAHGVQSSVAGWELKVAARGPPRSHTRPHTVSHHTLWLVLRFQHPTHLSASRLSSHYRDSNNNNLTSNLPP